jgi:hypothetical protein
VQVSPQGFEPRSITRKVQGERLVLGERACDQVPQPHVEEQARGESRGKVSPILVTMGQPAQSASLPVVQFEEFRRQISDRMPVEIAREISQAQA